MMSFFKKTKKNAFTMLELILVIVVLGILSAMALPRLERDLRQEAQNNIYTAIKHTQIMALSDNKTDPTDATWQKMLWQIRFRPVVNKWYYAIYSDTNQGGGADKDESAIDTSNGKYFYNDTGNYTIEADESPNVFLTKKYGIDDIDLSCGGVDVSNLIAFDHLGRTHIDIDAATGNDYATYAQNDCTLIVSFADTDITDLNFTIESETGHITVN
jgi:prepilin-type N-terminal cleavage/methylation domain-containing protein